MKLGQALAVVAFFGARKLLSGTTLTWKTVNNWIVTNANPDNYGRGYALNRLLDARTQAFAELHKEPLGKNGFRVTARIFFNARQGPAAAAQSWEVKKIDSELQKIFGRNLRVRIDV